MPDFISIRFYTSTDEDIYNVKLLRTFLSRLSEQGHYLSGEHDQSVNAAWLTAHYRTVSEETRILPIVLAGKGIRIKPCSTNHSYFLGF